MSTDEAAYLAGLRLEQENQFSKLFTVACALVFLGRREAKDRLSRE